MQTISFYLVRPFSDRNDWHLEIMKAGSGRPGDVLRRYSLGLAKPRQPFRCRLIGRRRRNIAEAWGGATGWFVDDKTVEALTTSGCTGWGTFPVTVDSGRRPPVVFYGLSITGRAGAGRSDDSLVDGTTLGFDPDEWDGSDIFTFAEMDFTLTTQRVMDAFTKARIMGWYFCQFDPRGTLLNSKAFYEQLKAEGKI